MIQGSGASGAVYDRKRSGSVNLMRQRNLSVDLAKFVASIMVIAIHTGLFADTNGMLYFATVQVICRLAVPFFAVCSGYFLSRQVIAVDRAVGKRAVLRQWKKLLVLYIVWTALYMVFSIPRWIETGWFSLGAFIDYAVGACTKGAYYHLWYLLGMICVLPVFWFLLRFCPKKYWGITAAGVWLLEVCVYAYGVFLPEAVSGVLSVLSKNDLILRLLPLLMVGAIIGQEQRKTKRFYILGFVISFVCLFAEAFLLNRLGQSAVSYIISTLPTAYFLFNCLLEVKLVRGSKWIPRLASVSLFIYCVHPMVLEIFSRLASNSIIHFVLSAVGATILGIAYEIIQHKRIGKKVISCSN